MNWSNMALKGTIGAGSLAPVAVLTDVLDPYIGVWGIIALVLVPVTLVAMIKIDDELSVSFIKGAHMLAVVWYVALVLATFSFMAWRGFVPSDALLGFLMLLGLAPCVAIVRAIKGGSYDRHWAAEQAEREN